MKKSSLYLMVFLASLLMIIPAHSYAQDFETKVTDIDFSTVFDENIGEEFFNVKAEVENFHDGDTIVYALYNDGIFSGLKISDSADKEVQCENNGYIDEIKCFVWNSLDIMSPKSETAITVLSEGRYESSYLMDTERSTGHSLCFREKVGERGVLYRLNDTVEIFGDNGEISLSAQEVKDYILQAKDSGISLYDNDYDGKIDFIDIWENTTYTYIIDDVYESGGKYYADIISLAGVKETKLLESESLYNEYKNIVYSGSDKADIKERLYDVSIYSDNEYARLYEQITYTQFENAVYSKDKQTIGETPITSKMFSTLGTADKMVPVSPELMNDGAQYNLYVYTTEYGDDILVITDNVGYHEYASGVFDKADGGRIYLYTSGYGISGTEPVSYEYDGDISDLSEGDVVAFDRNLSWNSDGSGTAVISDVHKALDVSSSYSEFSQSCRKKTALTDKILYQYPEESHTEFVLGPIVGKYSNSIYLGYYLGNNGETLTDGENSLITDDSCYINTDILDDFRYADNMKIYMYDYGKEPGERLSAEKDMFDIMIPNPPSFAYISGVCNGVGYEQSDKALLDLNSEYMIGNENDSYGIIRYALIKLVDGKISEIYVIYPSTHY